MKLMARRLMAVVLLPVNVMVVMPSFIYWWFEGGVSGQIFTVTDWHFWLALGMGLSAAGLMLASMRVFMRSGGDGTPAPWDPINILIISGPYRYVRNPMLIGVIAILFAEALFFKSWVLFGYAILFFVGNMIYFPLVEEKGLLARYGEAYRVYMRNVPRWLPLFCPYNPDKDKE